MYVHAYRRRWFQFCVLGGAEKVRLGRDGSIRGKWFRHPGQHKLDPYPPRYRTGWPESLVEDFANWGREPEDVCHFTDLYGPLLLSHTPLKPFRFDISEWLHHQDKFRKHWEAVSRYPLMGKPFPLSITTHLKAVAGEHFEFRGDAYTYVAANVYRFLLLELRCIERTRLRNCARPGCANPYFVASHLKQKYCSPDCAGWGQRQAKARWWHEHGVTARRRKGAQRKGAKKR